MIPNIRYLLVAASVATFAVSTSAQLLSGATNSATSVRPALPTPPPPPAVTATSAAQSAATSAATVRAPIAPAVNTSVATGAQNSVNASVARDIQVNAATQGSSAVQVQDLALTHGAAHEAALHLSAADTVQSIRNASIETRKELAAEIQARLDASSQALNQLKARADRAGERTRAEFGRAMKQVRSAEKELRSSLKATVKATKESTWGAVQSELAKDYSAYAEAVAAAEAAVSGGIAVSEAPKS